MQIVECLGTLSLKEMKEEDHIADLIMQENMMVRRNNLYVTSVTILDTLQEIVEHLIIRMEPIIEGMYLYISYVITLDMQQDSTKWIEGTLIGTLIIEGTTIGMIGGIKMEASIVKRRQSKNILKNYKKHL